MAFLLRPRVIVIFVLLLAAGVGAVALNDSMLYSPDSARYLLWARSLSMGIGFSDISAPEPTAYVVHAPFYPLVLVPAALIAPLNVVAAKATTLLLGMLLLWFVFTLVSRLTNEWVGCMATGFLAAHSLFLLFSTQILTEVPFALCLTIALAALVKDREQTQTLLARLPIAIALTAAMFLREVGVTIVAAALVLFAVRKDWKNIAVVGVTSFTFYVLWFVRNEVVVAGIEHPPLRNASLYFDHSFTPDSAPFVAELWARLTTNLSGYADQAGTFLFAQQFGGISYGLVHIDSPWMSFLMSALPYLIPLFIAVPLILIASAVGMRWKSSAAVRASSIMLTFYMLPILFYPISDMRFLFPAILFMTVLMAIGGHALFERFSVMGRRTAVRMALGPLAAVMLVPNISWVIAFTRNNISHEQDAEVFAKEIGGETSLSAYYLREYAKVGEWLLERTEPGEVVACRLKDLGLWLPERKILEIDPQMTPEAFDRSIRDYGVRYVVSLKHPTGLRENELQFEFSAVYEAASLKDFGALEVLALAPREAAVVQPYASDLHGVPLFRSALALLRDGHAKRADTLLGRVEEELGKWRAIAYHRAVAKALSGDHEGAADIFGRLRASQQAGSFVKLAWFHQDLLERVRRATSDPSRPMRAQGYVDISIRYWDLGYRRHARTMLDSALALQPNLFPALIFRAIFSYRDGEMESASRSLAAAAALEPSNVLVLGFQKLLRFDTRKSRERSGAGDADLLSQRAEVFKSMDMWDDAIDTWLLMLNENGRDRHAMEELAIAYEKKNRMGPSKKWADAYRLHYPDDETLDNLRKRLARRFLLQ